MQNEIKTEVIQHNDVRGNTQLYLKVSKGDKSHLINVGEKTYNAVKQILENTETSELQKQLDVQQELKGSYPVQKDKFNVPKRITNKKHK
jgi:predicted RNA-binding protein YlqC (UPF0109 family)